MKSIAEWSFFLKEEIQKCYKKCSNLSTLGSDHISWKHLKIIINNTKCLSNIIKIANVYINLIYLPSNLKKSTSTIIPNPNKVAYDSLKIFQPIILLNMLGKLMDKVIGERLQN